MLGVLLQDLPVDFRPLPAPDSLFPRHQTALNIRRQFPDDLEVEFIVLLQITVGAFDLQVFGCGLSNIQRDVVIADEVGEDQLRFDLDEDQKEYSFDDDIPVGIWNGECVINFRKLLNYEEEI